MNSASLAIAVLAATFACNSDDKAQPRIKVSVAPEVDRCLDALSHTSESGGQYLATLAKGCVSACPSSFEAVADAFGNGAVREAELWSSLGGCNLGCSARSMKGLDQKPLASRLPSLVGECGVSFYALPKGHDGFFSDTAFVAGRIHQWLERIEGALTPEQRKRLERVTTNAHIPLPPPPAMAGHYRLPYSNAGEGFESRYYLIIGDKGVSAAAPPVARLRGRTLELRPVPGGMPPGTDLPKGKELAAATELSKAWQDLHPLVPGKTGFTYLADSGQPVARLMELAAVLSHQSFRLGVAGVSTRQHQVEVAVQPGVGSAAPQISLFGGELAFPGGSGAGGITQQLRRALLERAPSASVELHLDPGTSVAELSRALDVIAAARGAKAFVTFATPDSP